jgi:hypothetical protein
MFAVIEGLNSPYVTRLTQTLQEVPPKTRDTINDFQAIAAKESNYFNYRELMKVATTPFIPFMYVSYFV